MNNGKLDPIYFLLVDDLEGNLLSLEGLLRRDDLIMLKARSGPEALEMLLQHQVDLALLDVQMPGMDGFELAELMRGNERTRHVPIIFLTAGNADRQRRFRGYEAGAVDFIHKPIEPDILRSKAGVFFDLACQRQQLAHQRDTLRTYAEALKEADRRKDEFLAVLAHELRNPLAPIRYGLEIMKMSAHEPVSEDIRAMMHRQLSHLVRLIDDLLDVSRISRGKINLNKEPVELSEALQAALEASRPLIEANKHTLVLQNAEEPIWIFADLTRIAQVVSNLLNNAAKYTPAGGRITLSVHRDGDHVRIAVADTGVGIPRAMLPRIFELFTQVDGENKRSQGGLGIGLALAQQLVEMHHGTLQVDSEGEGQGSTFTLRLPLYHEGGRPAAPEAPVPASALPLKVLVVDDNVSSAETTAQILAMTGHSVTLAHDGPEALDAARRILPDVIMLDLGMPGMSGYDVCREIRRDEAFHKTMLIAQTGWGQERDRERTREAGFDHHLTKPVDFNELSALLARQQPG